jgi:PAS domain S-box-containing protein
MVESMAAPPNLEPCDEVPGKGDFAQRRSAEDAIRETEARFRQIVEHIREVIWMSTVDFNSMLYVSPGYEEIWGRTCESLRQDPRSWIDAIHAEDRDRVAAIVERTRTQVFSVEYRVVRPDGSIRWVWDRGFPIKDDSGCVYRVAGIAEDITQRKRITEELRAKEQALAEAQHVARVGSWTWDIRERTAVWSDELYRLFGVEPGGIDPVKDTMSFVEPEDRDRVLGALADAIKTAQTYNFSYRIRRRDGEVRSLESRGYIVTNERGEAISAFGTTQDVTERLQAEEASRRSERLLRQVLDSLPVGVVVVDPEGNILLSNPAVASIWGGMISSGPKRYRASKGWWHDTGQPIKRDEWASVRARLKGETSINEVIDIETFDGVRKIIQNSSAPIRDEHHAIVGAVVINEDISARKSAEQDVEASASQMQALATRLMKAQDDERRNIARMLHETTAQDLAALKMHLARLTRTGTGLSSADRVALAESIELAERSITGIRTLSYLLHPPFLDEAGLLSALRWYAAGFSARSGIKVDLDLPSSFERLAQEVETALFRVIQEALINVHRHAGSDTASIRLRVDGRRLTLEIEDHGHGMPAMVIAQLTSGGSALGVGVTGMRERLQQLGGTLDIESSERGTTVRAQIPLGPEPA